MGYRHGEGMGVRVLMEWDLFWRKFNAGIRSLLIQLDALG